jgi:hypothetical protein
MNAQTMAVLIGALWLITPLLFLILIGKVADGADCQDEKR